MNLSRILLSTIAADSAETAKAYGLGLEIAEFCTASLIDSSFGETDQKIRSEITPGQPVILHAPFNELFPCAIDPKARELAAFRYRQAIDLAKGYGAAKVVIHGGYHPWIYFPTWYTQQSILFWRDFLQDDPGIQIVLENVLETEPDMLLDIISGVDAPALRMCLDIGHVNAYSKHSAMEWLERCAPCIDHFHIHNNDGSWDTHSGLDQGSMDMKTLLLRADALCPAATCTLELTETGPAVRWLLENHLI